MKVFLISGKAGSGKNEVANIIKKELGSTVITAFSKYIKLYALEFTDWDGRDITKPREFLQGMGDKLRSIDENFLTDRLIQDFDVYRETFENVIISDVRLPHEIEYIKENCNEDVYVVRVNSTKNKRNLNDKEKMHHTELDLDNYDKFDFIIENNFDETLVDNVKKVLEELR